MNSYRSCHKILNLYIFCTLFLFWSDRRYFLSTQSISGTVILVLEYTVSKGLMALCHSFCIFIFLLQCIHSYNHSLIKFAEALLHIFTPAGSVGETSLGCRAEIRTRARLTAKKAIPSALRCTLRCSKLIT